MSGATLGLFDGPAPRLRAVGASMAFLDLIAEAMVDALYRADDPFALADALVLLPNRRATRGLVDAFASRLGGAALLPAIRPLGDLGEEADVWGADPIAFDLPAPIDPTRQRMELAALVRARDSAAGGVEDPARALALADELGNVLDAAAAADEIHWERLPTLVEEAELAAHWQAQAAFLDIVARYWPQRLAAEGLADPSARRSMLLRALAREWTQNPPTRPIVIAGSTGSIAATRALMAAVARLPRGVVVLPGLDGDLDDESWDAVGDQHPQFALRETLKALGVARTRIALLGVESAHRRARRLLVREALAPAEKTADWLARLESAGGADFVAAGANGVSLLEAVNEDEEAAAIALLLRQALETPGRTAALVTPDAGLARRVEAKLKRWDVSPAVSHGAPLRETQPGSLAALLCELARDPAEPVALAALLKHPRAIVGRDHAAVTQLEHLALRGARRHETLADLAALEGLASAPLARELAARLAEALAPLCAVMAHKAITLADFANALAEAAENVAGEAMWRGFDGESVAGLLRDAIAHGAELGAMAPSAAPRVLLRLMQGKEALHASQSDGRIAIWGPLEARLQRRDLMILGGLNEGVWPAPAPQDPFLSRAMRERLGLPSLDQRIGLAAHDFAQLANAPELVLTRSLRRDGAPTLASRWLWRLQTLVKGAGKALPIAQAPLDWARALDAPLAPRAAKPPRPKPPAAARLKRISVTQVETLIRDPYAIYARRILGLEALKPIGAQLGPAERGTAIHKAIERFGDGGDAQMLLELLDEELRKAGAPPPLRAAERVRLKQSALDYIAWLDAGRAGRAAVFIEAKAALTLPGGVVLSAMADRIEIGKSGDGVIVDFKTGSPPGKGEVETGLAPQMTLQAGLLARGAFTNVAAAKAEALIYWRFGGTSPGPAPVALKDGAHAAGEQALRNLEEMLAKYARADQPFLSSPKIKFAAKYHDYDHLARRKEWADAEDGE